MTKITALGVLAAALLLTPVVGADDARDVLLTDFTSAGPSLDWIAVNDNVMGGRSRGGFRVAEDRLRFSGSTNTNGGGFSSIRTRPQAIDVGDADGIALRIQADGRRYTFQLRTSTTRGQRRSPTYWADFETRAGGGWQEVRIPFESFRPTWRGMKLRGPVLETSKIDGLGLMIYDKRDGAFELEVDWIKAYPKPTRPADDN